MFDHYTTLEREAKEHYQARLDEREHDRLVSRLQAGQASAHHRFAQQCGRVLVWAGAALLRYGRAAEEQSMARASV